MRSSQKTEKIYDNIDDTWLMILIDVIKLLIDNNLLQSKGLGMAEALGDMTTDRDLTTGVDLVTGNLIEVAFLTDLKIGVEASTTGVVPQVTMHSATWLWLTLNTSIFETSLYSVQFSEENGS